MPFLLIDQQNFEIKLEKTISFTGFHQYLEHSRQIIIQNNYIRTLKVREALSK